MDADRGIGAGIIIFGTDRAREREGRVVGGTDRIPGGPAVGGIGIPGGGDTGEIGGNDQGGTEPSFLAERVHDLENGHIIGQVESHEIKAEEFRIDGLGERKGGGGVANQCNASRRTTDRDG